MKRVDLRTVMVVELKNGDIFMVAKGLDNYS